MVDDLYSRIVVLKDAVGCADELNIRLLDSDEKHREMIEYYVQRELYDVLKSLLSDYEKLEKSWWRYYYDGKQGR